MRGAFAGDVAASPLAIASVLGIQHPHRAALRVWWGVSFPRSEPNYSAPSDSAYPGVMHARMHRLGVHPVLLASVVEAETLARYLYFWPRLIKSSIATIESLSIDWPAFVSNRAWRFRASHSGVSIAVPYGSGTQVTKTFAKLSTGANKACWARSTQRTF